jgi:hypothetical protein
LKMSETLRMSSNVRLALPPVNMIDVDESDNLSLMSKEAGDRLKEARGNHFPSAAAAARHFGLSASTYRAHENGQNAFDVDQCAMYAAEYGVSPSWLAWGVSEKASELAADIALLARIPFWIRGLTEGLRPEASPDAVDAMVKAGIELLRNRRVASQFSTDPDQLRLLARYEAGKLL